MSLTTSSICLSKYYGIPSDVSNLIVSYLSSENAKYIPQYNTMGDIYYKINTAYFIKLSEICEYNLGRTSMNKPHEIVLNTRRYNNAITVLQRKWISEDGKLRLTLYTTVEIAPDTYEYLSVSYSYLLFDTTPIRQFEKGTLFRPMETNVFNQQQRITSFNMENDVMYVSHTEVHAQFVWNNALNFGEYVVDMVDGIFPNVADDEDEIDWAF